MDTSKNIKIPEQTKAELKAKAQELGVLYDSDAMAEVMYLANTAANAKKITVLITGETGVGKGQIVNIIHNWSDRADKEPKYVDCGAITSGDLLQSELFGHEEGAYTDAKGQRIGAFELADGGTIFLDEIGNMDPKAQEKLLSVIEGKGFTRLGGETEITVDV